jgi:crotonobetainyl-CoA:carnitine CoA-transferase CaiB-like acyl-CoA transferase
MLDGSAALLTYQAANYFATGTVPTRRGNAHPSLVPYSAYPCADGTIILAVGNDSLFQRFCVAIGTPELASQPEYVTVAARVEHRDALDAELSAILSQRRRDDWITLLREHGIPCGAVRDVGEVCTSSQLNARDMLPTLDHPTAGKLRQLGSPVQLGGSPCALRLPPPLLGQHTEEILADLLGLSAEEVAALREQDVI